MKHCNNTCDMYDADNSVCCAADEPYVSVKLGAECFFDAHDRDHPYIEPLQTNADHIRSMTDEELAQMIIRSQKKDPSILWCRDEYGCADLDDSFDCTDELQASCIVRWLRQPKETQT